jgi:hypothetical protein
MRTRWTFVALIGLVVVALVSIGTRSAIAQHSDPKVYVCKYVGTPGVDERLQTGQNPIEVSVNATGGVAVGSWFADAHGRSYVLGTVPMVPEPTRADCPLPDRPVTGRVEITKVVVGEDAPAGMVFEISLTPAGGSAITRSISGSGVVVFDDLEPGLYALSEDDPGSDWTVRYSSTSITVEAGETASATVTNTYAPPVVPPELGSVVLTKVVTGEPPAATYEVGLVGPAPARTERWQTVVGAGHVTFSALPVGTYTVVERDPGPEYTVTITPTTVVVTNGGAAAATVENAYAEQASLPPTGPPTAPPTSPPTAPPTSPAGPPSTDVGSVAPVAGASLPNTGGGGQLAILTSALASALVVGGSALAALSRRKVS